MNMNIQNLMKQAQKMQKDLQKTQKELECSEYEGSSSFVKIVLNGNKEMKLIKISFEDEIAGVDDIEMLEDMIMIAYNEASKKVDEDKEKRMGKYGSGLSGLM